MSRTAAMAVTYNTDDAFMVRTYARAQIVSQSVGVDSPVIASSETRWREGRSATTAWIRTSVCSAQLRWTSGAACRQLEWRNVSEEPAHVAGLGGGVDADGD